MNCQVFYIVYSAVSVCVPLRTAVRSLGLLSSSATYLLCVTAVDMYGLLYSASIPSPPSF